MRLLNNGSFAMGSPSCPVASSITVNVPGGNESFGVDNVGSYDVHGVMQVGCVPMLYLEYLCVATATGTSKHLLLSTA
jgi:hypothetical protein